MSRETSETLAQIFNRIKSTDAAPSMKLFLKGQTLTIAFKSESVEIATLFRMFDIGSTDGEFHTGLVGQIASLVAQGHAVSRENSNFVMPVVRSKNRVTN